MSINISKKNKTLAITTRSSSTFSPIVSDYSLMFLIFKICYKMEFPLILIKNDIILRKQALLLSTSMFS